jgi:hypothetical protein
MNAGFSLNVMSKEKDVIEFGDLLQYDKHMPHRDGYSKNMAKTLCPL